MKMLISTFIFIHIFRVREIQTCGFIVNANFLKVLSFCPYLKKKTRK